MGLEIQVTPAAAQRCPDGITGFDVDCDAELNVVSPSERPQSAPSPMKPLGQRAIDAVSF